MEYIIEMTGITKKFPGVIANDNITLRLKKGEIHALLGENGAGKSTLMNILFGLCQPDSGAIRKHGVDVKINAPSDAARLGIGMVHQNFKLVHNFTVLENIILGHETTKHGLLRLDYARQRIRELSDSHGLAIDPDALVSDITVGMRQRTAILKMLYRDNEILIFDEPTAVLTPQEGVELMKTMKSLSSQGKSILFITHKLDEIKAAADRCTVLRRGKCASAVDMAETTKEDLSEMMMGRKAVPIMPRSKIRPGGIVLDVRGLTVKDRAAGKNAVDHVSFQVHAGEIVCIAGIDGNGQNELVYALTGLLRANAGHITLDSRDITEATVRQRRICGMAHIPGDRHRHGLVPDYSVAYNLILQRYFEPIFQKRGFLNDAAIYAHANDLIKTFDIRSGQGAGMAARTLSGGHQQKVVVAREIDQTPKLLIAVQPTRGLDAGAVSYVHERLVAACGQGTGVLLVSLDLDEALGISDRILVMFKGGIVSELNPKTVTSSDLGLHLSGIGSSGVTA